LVLDQFFAKIVHAVATRTSALPSPSNVAALA
jgi:hypothetical protein